MNDVDAIMNEQDTKAAQGQQTESVEDTQNKPVEQEEKDDNVSRETSDDYEGSDEQEGDKPEDSEGGEPETDEYGNEIPKQEKMYTESQVQAMIRDRLSRGRFANQEPQQPQNNQPQAKDFEYDENSSKSWEEQLESFMDNWASKREKKQQEQQWQAREEKKQAEFQSKFTNGMSRYQDFHDVVSTQPIDDTMLIATRDMKDPAAFIYAASKKQPAELQRIAQIQDPYTKMAEMGRLDERMKKQKQNKSNAPRPAGKTQGDNPKIDKAKSIDDRIQKYAEKRLRR